MPFNGGSSGSSASRSLFSRALARARAGGAPAKILLNGHSHVAAIGAGTSGTEAEVSCVQYGLGAQMAPLLSAAGISTDFHSFCGDGNFGTITTIDSRVTFTGGAAWPTVSSATLGGDFLQSPTSSTTRLVFTPGYSFTSFRVWYIRYSTSSTQLLVYADTTLMATVNANGGFALLPVDVNVPGGAVSVGVQSGDGVGVALICIECFRVSQVATIVQAGFAGAQTSNLINTSSVWAPLNAQRTFAADLTVLYAVTNDLNNGVAVATFKTNLSTLAAAATETGDCILVMDPPDNPSSYPNWGNGTSDTFATAVNEVAAAYGCNVVDLRKAYTRLWVNSNAAGLMFNSIHPNAAGHGVSSSMITSEILKLA